MRVTISGKNMSVSNDLKTKVQEKLNNSVTKYFDRAIESKVVFATEGHLIDTKIHVNEGVRGGIDINCDARDENADTSFEIALNEIEKQLRRYKRKIKSHKKTSLKEATGNAVSQAEVI